MSDVPFFVPAADVHAHVVIAPSALSASHGHPPSSDSRVEARATEDGNVSKSKLRKPVHELQRLIPLQTTQKDDVAKTQWLRGRRDVHVKPIQSTTTARGLVDVELNDEKRIYGHENSKPTRRKRRLSATSTLDPLKHIKDQQTHAQAQEMALAKALEMKMDRVGGRIPVQFLLERQHKAVAERVVLHAMCKVLSGHYRRVLHIAFRYWTRRTLILRVLEDHERQEIVLCSPELRWTNETSDEGGEFGNGRHTSDGGPVSTAAAISEKYEWLTYSKALVQRENHALTEQAEKARQEKLLAIRVQQEAILRDAFDRYDADHSGSIDRTEFKSMFKEELCQPLSDEQVTEAMAAMDKSGNGLIEFDELLAWFVEEQLNQQEAGPVNESTSLALLKEALRGKRQMRRYKEKLNEFLPHLSSGEAKADEPPSVVRQRVRGFPAVECLEHSDFARKRKVFYRFVHEICNLDWIYEDEAVIPVTNAMEVFDQVFLPRWNGGQLTYDFYFDDESFEFEGEMWYRRWDSATKKYYFYTTRKKTRTVAIESHKKQKRKKSKSDAHVQVIEETVEVREAIDPRRKEMLLELARAAFTRADADNSGYIDTEEFHRMLNNELCEPVSKSKARQVMKQLDADGSGKIDFNEFFQWYATEKCQDYPVTAKMERARALLKTKQRAKASARAAVDASVAGSTKLKEVIDRKMKEHQLARDCKGASAELITLLEEGFPKGLAEKALALHNQDVVFARQWLQEKHQEEQRERETAARERANRKAQAKKDARTRSLTRRQKIVAMRKQVKLVLLGPSKKEAHTARVDQALMNLDREIKLVERQMTTKFR
ncbi:hypothetical protein Poli38472_002670 [Pythium oligandrum]|uniref:EF-hand domain-containing protein n=1 Tax=Pythium oligandrum TaxID=41045 RepID=A0A8K1CHL3_PYTOL|nr:hypothetical protein Poli38472_002670 [Pythium oligandrum]|eukprot:TMW63729.1 hypothetical protein Poli38472_002670 [Pythium oligandrum]